MKTIIAGSRDLRLYKFVIEAVNKAQFKITEVVSGGANGIDKLAIEYAIRNEINCTVWPAKWKVWGRQAGYRRNDFMAGYASQLIAIWDGKSKGTKMMIDLAKKKGLKVFVDEIQM